MEPIPEKSLKIIECITNFISDLNDNFTSRNKPISLYNRLLSRDNTLSLDQVNKHIAVFKSFFQSNPDYIPNKKLSSNPIIKYSDHVYVNLDKIYKKTVEEDHPIIYNHLLTIYSLVSNNTECLELAVIPSSTEESTTVQDSIKSKLPSTAEGDFIKSAIDLTSSISEKDMEGMVGNPLEAAAKIMQGDKFSKITSDLTTKIESGEISIEGLLSTAMGMLGGLSGGGGGAAGGIDMGAIMKMVGGLNAHQKLE